MDKSFLGVNLLPIPMTKTFLLLEFALLNRYNRSHWIRCKIVHRITCAKYPLRRWSNELCQSSFCCRVGSILNRWKGIFDCDFLFQLFHVRIVANHRRIASNCCFSVFGKLPPIFSLISFCLGHCLHQSDGYVWICSLHFKYFLIRKSKINLKLSAFEPLLLGRVLFQCFD